MPFKKGNQINKGRKPWNTGKKRPKFSDETKKKMSNAKKGKIPKNIAQIAGWNKGIKNCYKLSDKTKKKIGNAAKGRICSIETRRKRSDSLKRAHREGRHGSWKGGISFKNQRVRQSFELKLWKKICLERDNFTCQKTGQNGGKLNIHHINNFAEFPELRTSIENGITLSEKAHIEFHKIYGKKDNTKEQLLEFLSK